MFGCILHSTPPIQACYYLAHEWISGITFDMGTVLGYLIKAFSVPPTEEETEALLLNLAYEKTRSRSN